MRLVRVALVAAVSLFTLCLTAKADDVSVKVITPDKPPVAPTQPDPASPTASPMPTRPPVKVASPDDYPSGDWMFDRSFQELHLSADEMAVVRPVFKEFRDQFDANRKAFFEKIRGNQDKRAKLYEQVKRDASGKPVTSAELEALEKEYTAWACEGADRTNKLRQQMIEKVSAALPEAKATTLKELIAEGGPDAIRGRERSDEMSIKNMFPGVEFDAAKMARAREILKREMAPYAKFARERQEQLAELNRKPADDPARKEAGALNAGLMEAYNKQLKIARAAIAREMLTDEQQRAVVEAREKLAAEGRTKWAENQLSRYAKLGLTADQRKKVQELVDAAVEVMAKGEADGLVGFLQLSSQFAKDVEALLTDAQKAKLKP